MAFTDPLEPEQIEYLTNHYGSVQAAAIKAIRERPELFAPLGIYLNEYGIPCFPTPELNAEFWERGGA